MEQPVAYLSQVENLSPVTLNQVTVPVHKSSFSTLSTSTQAHSESELNPEELSKKKKRTVTFGEIDVTELNYQATKTPPEERRRWRRQAIRRKIERKEYRQRITMGLLKGCIAFLFFTLCSIVVLLATAQGTHTKIQTSFI